MEQHELRSRYPGIVKATIYMAFGNGGITHGPNHDRQEDTVLADLDTLLTAETAKGDLHAIDNWLMSLSEDTLNSLVNGTDAEMTAICAQAPNPGKAEALLEGIMERVI